MNRHRPRFALLLLAGLLVTTSTVLAATSGTIRGNARANTIRGTAGPDSIYGLGGNDKLYGGAGNDKLYGGAGDDLVVGGPGTDFLSCGPGANDSAIGGVGDKATKDCEHVRGIPTQGGSTPPPPPPPPPAAACTNGKDDDGDGKIDFPSDPGCESAADTDETDPPPPPALPGQYCGFTDQGPDLCITTSPDARSLTEIRTAAIVDCTNGDRWQFGVTLSGRSIPIQPDRSFSYEFTGTLTDSSGALANIQESEFVKGTFTTDGKAAGTLAITHISFDYQGQHWECSQGAVGWHTTKQG